MLYDYLFNISLIISAITLWNIFIKNTSMKKHSYILINLVLAGILIALIDNGVVMESGNYRLNFSHVPIILLVLSGSDFFALFGVATTIFYYGFQTGFMTDPHKSLILYLSVIMFIGIQVRKKQISRCDNWIYANLLSIAWMVGHAVFFYSADILTSFTSIGFIGLNFITSNVIYIIYKKIKNDETVWRKIKEEAFIDFLTDVYNKRKFKEDHSHAIDQPETQKISIAMFDIDHFKNINDTYGHSFGDIVLKGVAKKLKNVSKNIYRVGGEEFLVMFINEDDSFIKESIEKVREDISKIVWDAPNGEKIKITISSGLASCDKSVFSTFNIVDEADKKLYLAKAMGRNKCYF